MAGCLRLSLSARYGWSYTAANGALYLKYNALYSSADMLQGTTTLIIMPLNQHGLLPVIASTRQYQVKNNF